MRALTAALISLLAVDLFADVPAPRVVTLKAPDGVELKATYYGAGRPGPAVMLLHMCDSTRTSWEPLATRLAAAGIHSLAVDYRGFGESGGLKAQSLPPAEGQKLINEKWPGDIDTAYAFLVSQEGVDAATVGAAGGSCGVNQAVMLAQRHPEIRSLVLLAGPASAAALRFLDGNPSIPLFAAAAADDQYDEDIGTLMQWILALSGNPRNRYAAFKDGGHGTQIFVPHPELPKQIVDFYLDTLVKNRAERGASFERASSPMREFWLLARDPESAAKAVALFNETRKASPAAVLFPEGALNLLGYQHLQAGKHDAAIALFKVNTVAYPVSANAWDSLGDAYVAAGLKDQALEASRKALERLATDPSAEAQKQAIRASAEQKIQELTKKSAQ